MATGQPAFAGGTAAEIFDAILNRPPIPARSVNPKLPLPLAEIIARSLEKDPAARCQDAGKLRADLQGLKRELDSGRTAPAASAPASAQKSVAVLYFENASAAKEVNISATE